MKQNTSTSIVLVDLVLTTMPSFLCGVEGYDVKQNTEAMPAGTKKISAIGE